MARRSIHTTSGGTIKRVHLTINGPTKEFAVAKDRRLLELLREDLGLTGAKKSCDRKGRCGTIW